METATYKIVFRGEIGPDFVLDNVKVRLAELFQLEGERLERLFSGSSVVLKKNLPLELAVQYKRRFEQSGALCEVEREANPRSEHMPPPSEPSITSPFAVPAAESSPEPAASKTSGTATHAQPYYELTLFSHFWCYFQGQVIYILVFGAGVFVSAFVEWEFNIFGYPLYQVVAALMGATRWGQAEAKLRREGPVTLNIRFWIAALVVAFVAWGLIAFTGALNKVRKEVESRPKVSITQSRLESLNIAMRVIQNIAMDGMVPFPETPEQIVAITRSHRTLFPQRAWISGPDLLKDEWDTPIQYERQGMVDYFFRSAGPDKVFGTEDDLRLSSQEAQRESSFDGADGDLKR